MMTLLEVKCPHCDARGQVLLPPLGAIIFGPCPECDNPIVVFLGQCLPLEKHIMESGGNRQKIDHFVQVLTDFIRAKAETEIFTDEPGVQTAAAPKGGITTWELQQFERELPEDLDDPRRFRQIFGLKPPPDKTQG